MPTTSKKLTVDGTDYELRITFTPGRGMAQAFLNGEPAGPQISISFTAQQFDDFEAQGRSSKELLAGMVSALIGIIRNNLRGPTGNGR